MPPTIPLLEVVSLAKRVPTRQVGKRSGFALSQPQNSKEGLDRSVDITQLQVPHSCIVMREAGGESSQMKKEKAPSNDDAFFGARGGT